jgi:CBS domain-containing protein
MGMHKENTMTARDLMTPNPAVITADDAIPKAAEMMKTLGVGMLPVVADLQHRRLLGVLTDRDIVVRYLAIGHLAGSRVSDHMTRDPLVTVSADASLSEIAEKMEQHQVRRLPVVSDDGAVIGIVTQADLAISVGPNDPQLIEQIVERVSRPGALVY